MPDDLVSIGMPVYNGERYLEAAIRSNLEQTVANLELIISDNASTDGTESICREFAAADSRVRYVRNDVNIGAAANYNNLFSLARGEYFRWSNADDLAAPQLLERALPILRSRPDVVLAYGLTCLIDEEGQLLKPYDDNLDLQDESASRRYVAVTQRLGLTNIIYGLMRASALKKTELMGNGKLPAGDVSFISEMSLFGKFAEIPERLFYRRMHKEAFSALQNPQEERQFWSASTAPVALPLWRARLKGAKVIARSPLPIREKAYLLGFSAKRLFWERGQLGSELVSVFSSRVNQ